jgi:hypothetical protein
MKFCKIKIFNHPEIKKILLKAEDPLFMKKMIYSYSSVSENMTKGFKTKSKISMERQFYQEAIILH